MRVGFGGAYALDLTAVLATAQVLDLDLPLVAELAGDLEPLLLFAWRPPDDGS